MNPPPLPSPDSPEPALASLPVDWLVYLFVALGLGLLLGFAGAWLIQRARLTPSSEHTPERFRELGDELVEIKSAKAQLEGEQSERRSRLEAAEEALRQARESQQRAAEDNARLERDRRHLEQALDAKLEESQKLQEQLQDRFQQLAAQLLEKTSAKFTQTNQEKLDGLLSPFRRSLEEFRKRSEEQYSETQKGRGELNRHLEQLKDLNVSLSEQAQNLTTALRGDSQAQGAWGEFILENLLAKSGLTKGVEFETQESFTGEEGQRLRPDVVLHYPEQQGSLIIDSKVSLVAYERYCSTEDEDEKAQALSDHLTSLRAHIKGLGEKRYDEIPNLRSPDFVLLFVPIEHAFNLAAHADPRLYDEAFERKVVLITPATLLATLKMVKSIWRQDQQSKNALEIARRGGLLYDKFANFYKTLTVLGSQLDKTSESYQKALGLLQDGRGSLTSQVEELKRLGAKASKELPAEALPEQFQTPSDPNESRDESALESEGQSNNSNNSNDSDRAAPAA